ncbi:cell wall-binding repeat-containing protein [Clostridium sp.]|uniref:cell wall-binding repeat-containing protein n=1 Tax=Clostridium sp. TaxID=1506 RepID=UPI003D6D7984
MLKTFKYHNAKIGTTLVITFFMTLTLFSTFTMTAKADIGDKVFDIIEITDLHGALISNDAIPLPIGGVLAKNIKDTKATNPDRTIIIGGGDLYQGSPISIVLRGVPVQKSLSNIGMEVTALGNHEFDWQLDTVVNTTMRDASYSIVAANLYNKNVDGTKGNRKFAPYKIIVKDGVRIAFIGAITNLSEQLIIPAYRKDYIFTDAATEVNACAAEIKAAQTADVIIAIIHAGNDYKTPTTGEIFTITNKLTNVNAVFGGHSHTLVTATAANGIPVYIANYSGRGYIDAKMTVQLDNKVSFAVPSISDYKALDTTSLNGYKIGNPNLKPGDPNYVAGTPVQDPEVKAIIDAAAPTFSEVIGTTKKTLTRTHIGSPYGESILGNWTADAIRLNATSDIGIQNNGGLRSDIKSGPINVGNIFFLMPYDYEINTVLLTKEQLKVILEQAVKDGGKGLQTSGIKFTYDSTEPTGSRVLNITREDGTAISDTEILKLAGPDYILTGGDGFKGFLDANVSNTILKTGVLVRDALIANIKANNGINYVLNIRLKNIAKTIPVILKLPTLQRLAGLNRIETSLSIAKQQYTDKAPDAVVLATANDFADALAGSGLAYKYNAPLLLVNKTISNSKNVLDYITSNLGKNKNIYILGGTGAVSKDISDYLTVQGYKIIRLGGKDRYETNHKIVNNLNTPKGTSIVIATGSDFADALSISSIAAINGYSMLLNGKDNLSASVSRDITNIQPTTVYLIGGTGVLSTNIETQIKNLNKEITIVRLGGKNRYETSMNIVKHFNLTTTTIAVATGIDFPDALSGSVLAARNNCSVLLVDNKDITKQKELIIKQKITNVILFGGEGVVSKAIATSLIQK